MPVIVEGLAGEVIAPPQRLGFSARVPSTMPARRDHDGPCVALVGEAAGKDEAALGKPFIGQSGRLLRAALRQAGIDEERCGFMNVFGVQPPNNDLKAFTVARSALPASYPRLPALTQGRYVHPWWLQEVERLRSELEALRPSIAVALGNTAVWGLMIEAPKISRVRGAPAESKLIPGLKVLPTYHPAAVLRKPPLYPVLLADLHKAAYEAEFHEIRRPPRWINIRPKLAELWEFVRWCLSALPPWPYGFDVETSTRGGTRQITCLSIAHSPDMVMVAPFCTRTGEHYWSAEEEPWAWRAVFEFLTSPAPKVMQHGAYDTSWIWDLFKVPSRGWVHDTLYEHHAKFPELPRALGFLGSLYTLEPAWKTMRPKGRERSEKRDE